jgi:hypothetical protein
MLTPRDLVVMEMASPIPGVEVLIGLAPDRHNIQFPSATASSPVRCE